MNKRKIGKLRRELRALRAGKYNLKTSDLVRFARKVGRLPNTQRGKEPTYVSPIPGTRPLSIPGHTTINPYTADAIMDSFEEDLGRWEDLLEKEPTKSENTKRLPPATICTNRDSGGTQ
jgi:hypothetical protein